MTTHLPPFGRNGGTLPRRMIFRGNHECVITEELASMILQRKRMSAYISKHIPTTRQIAGNMTFLPRLIVPPNNSVQRPARQAANLRMQI